MDKYSLSLLGRKKKQFLSDLVSSVRLGDLSPFIDTRLGSIPLSTLHVDYASTPLALDGSSHKKGPDALGT